MMAPTPLEISDRYRILGGEKPGDIKTPATGFALPKFDWSSGGLNPIPIRCTYALSGICLPELEAS